MIYSASYSTNISAQQQRNRAARLLLITLIESDTPISLQELEIRLASKEALSGRAIAEAAWKLVEEGKVQFTPAWDLEAC